MTELEQGNLTEERVPAQKTIDLRRVARFITAAVAAIATTLIVNRIGMAWLADMDLDPNDQQALAFHDGCAMFLTLAVPALFGGGMGGIIARDDGYYAAAAAFVVWCGVGAFCRFWAIPTVAHASAHNGLLHYFLYNPLPTLAFGALGGWFAGQFSSGKFSLNDTEPVVVPGSDE